MKPDGARQKRDELKQAESTNKRAQEKQREQRRTKNIEEKTKQENHSSQKRFKRYAARENETT